MDCVIKFKFKNEPDFRYIEVTNCPLYTEIQENGKKKKVICKLTTEDFVHDIISQCLQKQGLQGCFHSIEVIKDGYLIATAESLRERGSLKFISET